MPRSISGAFGGIFLRRRQQFPIRRRKRYPIPAQKGATECSGRIWRPFPAQAATIFHSAPKKIPHFCAEGCYGVFRAGRAANSCAGGYNFPFRAEIDTPFSRRTLPRSYLSGKMGRIPRRSVLRNISGAFGGPFLRGKLQRSNPRGIMGRFTRRQQQFSAVRDGGFGGNTSICYYSYGIV